MENFQNIQKLLNKSQNIKRVIIFLFFILTKSIVPSTTMHSLKKVEFGEAKQVIPSEY